MIIRTLKTLSELMWKHGRWSLFRPVRSDQSEHTMALKRQALKQSDGQFEDNKVL